MTKRDECVLLRKPVAFFLLVSILVIFTNSLHSTPLLSADFLLGPNEPPERSASESTQGSGGKTSTFVPTTFARTRTPTTVTTTSIQPGNTTVLQTNTTSVSIGTTTPGITTETVTVSWLSTMTIEVRGLGLSTFEAVLAVAVSLVVGFFGGRLSSMDRSGRRRRAAYPVPSVSAELEDLYNQGILEPDEYLMKRALAERKQAGGNLESSTSAVDRETAANSNGLQSLVRLKEEGLIDDEQFRNLASALGRRRT